MEPKQLAQGMAAARLALGVGFILAPGLTGRLWIGRLATDGRAKLLTRAIGARDAAIGAGILAALAGEGPVRRWVEAAAASDAVDVAAAVMAGDSIPRYARWAIFLLGGSSAAQGAYAAPKLGGS